MDTLRKVKLLEGYTLEIGYIGKSDNYGKAIIEYEFADKNGNVIFEGCDFHCSPMNAIDSDKCLRSLLSFLTLKPGDTDSEYFEGYTKEQMDFAQGDAELLSLHSIDESPEPFKDIK